MLLLAICLVLNIQLSLIFASPPSPLPVSSQTDQEVESYECGNVLFSNHEVQETLSLALESIDRGFRYPEKYQGKLNTGSGLEEYFLYPIRNGLKVMPQSKSIRSFYFIFFTRNDKKKVDVVTRLTTDDLTKCIRKYRTHRGLSHFVPDNANGYLCGHTFFSDDTIHQCLTNAQTIVDGNSNYPSPYVGSLYPEDGGYLMWPIMSQNALYKSGTNKIQPYFLILNNQRQVVVDVVVRGFRNNFLRCLRIRKPPTAPESDPFSKLFVKPPRSGYVCGKIFFNDKVLEENAEIVKGKVAKAIQSNVLQEYFGPPFYERCFMLQILQDGRLFRNGRKGPFRLILTPEYKVKSVAMLIKDKLKPCERDTIVAKKNHDTSAYYCNTRRFSHQELLAAAEEACVKMNTAKNYIYPARCEDTGFKSHGPHFIHPLHPADGAGKFICNPGSYRVVINTNCEVIGALTTSLLFHNESSRYKGRKKLMRCHRIDDGPLPPEIFGANAKFAYC